MFRIYLLNPPFVPRYSRSSRWAARCRGGALYYPIWLAYATGVLEKAGYDVRLVDAPAWKWNLDDIKKDIKKFKPSLLVSESNFQSLHNDLKIMKEIKTDFDTTCVAVGPPASCYSEFMLKDGADIVARFEYEFTIKAISEIVESGSHLRDIEGISYLDDNKIVHNANRPFISSEELDELPFVSQVYRKHLNIEDYSLGHTLYPMVQLFTGRGCPNYCTFCSWPSTLMGRKYRYRSVINVLNEIEYIIDNLPKVKEIFLEDDTFTIKKERIRQFCKGISERKLDITWSCNARANLDYELLVEMKNAGCRLLDVGYESGSDTILNNIRKGITVRDSMAFTENAKKAGLMILADFIIGMNGETKDTIKQTLKFVKHIKPNIIQFSVATPIPGTEFFNWAKENRFLLTEDLEKSLDKQGFQKCIVSYPGLTNKDIEMYVKRGLKEYYLNLNYVPIAMSNIFRKNGLHELKAMAKSALVLINYLGRS